MTAYLVKNTGVAHIAVVNLRDEVLDGVDIRRDYLNLERRLGGCLKMTILFCLGTPKNILGGTYFSLILQQYFVCII